MQIKEGVDLNGLRVEMLDILSDIESVWIVNGREEGVTITAGLDGKHKKNSKHYEGLALDLRTRYWSKEEQETVFDELNVINEFDFDGDYDIVMHKTHIHIEYDPKEED